VERDLTLKLLTDHDVNEDYHEWVTLLNTRYRDWLGRKGRNGARGGFRWIVFICNNQECPAEAIMREADLEFYVQQALR
jgi:hypothetical protein